MIDEAKYEAKISFLRDKWRMSGTVVFCESAVSREHNRVSYAFHIHRSEAGNRLDIIPHVFKGLVRHSNTISVRHPPVPKLFCHAFILWINLTTPDV